MFNANEFDNSSSPNRIHFKYTKHLPNNIENKLYSLNDEDSKLIKDICIKNVPFWNNLNYDDIEIKITSYSVSNLVLTVKLTFHYNNYFHFNTLIVKKRSKFTDFMFNTDLQHSVAKLLGDNGLGPRLIGRFSDYTIQEYVEGNILKNSSFQNLSVITSLASSLAKFHKKGTEISPAEWDRTPLVFRQINKWSQHAERIIKKHNLDFDFNELQSSFEMYKTLLENHIKTSNSLANSVLFCHNDLFYKNILHFQHGIYFIDFDYAGFNYVGWDIATFLLKICILYNINAYPRFFYDKTLDFSDEFKSIFVSVYLSQLLNKNVLPSEIVVKEFLDSLEVHRLGVELFWTYWGIIMFDKPTSEFSMYFDAYQYTKFHYDLHRSQLEKLTH